MFLLDVCLIEPLGIETYSSKLLGFLSNGTGHRLEGNRGEQACNTKNVLTRVVPVVIVGLENASRSVILRKGRRLGTNDISLALEDEDIVVFKLNAVSTCSSQIKKWGGVRYQVVVGIPRLGCVNGSNVLELLEHMVRGRGAIVEEEHDPCVDQRTIVGCHDDSSLVVRIVRGEFHDSIQDLRGLVRSENIVASPHLVVLRVRLESVVGDNAKVVTTTLQSTKQIGVLLGVRVDDRSIGKDDLEIDDIVGSPTILRAEETQTT